MDVGIIVFFKAQYQKLVIQYQIKYSNANKVFAIDIYQVVVMVEHAWRAGVTTLTKLLEATYILLIFIEKDKEKIRCLVEVDEVATLLYQLTLLSSDSEVGDVMNTSIMKWSLI
jgi:hypothetical protein